MWTRQLPWIEPTEAACRLAGLPRLAWLDSAMRHPTLGRYSYLAADPFGTFSVTDGCARWNGRPEPGRDPLDALRRRLRDCRTARVDGLPPFAGGAIGRVAYEFGWTLEGRRPPVPGTDSELDLAFYDVVVAFDHEEHRCCLVSSGLPVAEAARPARAEARLDAFAARLAGAATSRTSAPAPAPALDWRPAISRARYRAGVERVQAFIRAGDIYQANIAQRFTAPLPAASDLLAIFEAVRVANPAPFGAFLAGDDGRAVLSTSPELFLRTDGHRVETRPIKGTARRAARPAADAAAAQQLLGSTKDRAENVMIVDLLRNDLSRVCEPTTVAVPALCGLESYAGLHHLVSVVTGTLRPGCDALDLLAASFPGGSITGAPKLRAMEIIAAIEGEPRGTYCGAIGAFGFDGSMDLNIAIRTLVAGGGVIELRAGGGITVLSDPDAEYEETLTKAHRLFDALSAATPAARADRNPCVVEASA